MSYQLVAATGAKLQCPMGSTASRLVASNALTIKVENKLLATINDSKPIKNIPPFGVCTITGGPCMPLLSTPWLGSIGMMFGVTTPVLPADSKLPCAAGGIITITDSNQSTVWVATLPQPLILTRTVEQEEADDDDGWGPDFVHDAIDAVGDTVGDAAGDLKDYAVENPFDAATWFIPGPGTIYRFGKLGIQAGKAGSKLLRSGDKADDAGDSVKRILSGHELRKRDLHRRKKDGRPDPYHNFPEYIDQEVLEHGTRTVVSKDYVLYELRGKLNGVEGTYEIGARPSKSGRNEVITHRFFDKNKK
jgi:hypothetical protein